MSVLNVLRGGLAVAAIVGFAAPASAIGTNGLVAKSVMAPAVVYADEMKCPDGEEWNEETKKCEKKQS